MSKMGYQVPLRYHSWTWPGTPTTVVDVAVASGVREHRLSPSCAREGQGGAGLAEKVWEVATKSVPELIAQLEPLLPPLPKGH
jgi:hypothetical protein